VTLVWRNQFKRWCTDPGNPLGSWECAENVALVPFHEVEETEPVETPGEDSDLAASDHVETEVEAATI
jgi:hypothetical protein